MRALIINKVNDYLYTVVDQEKGRLVLQISSSEPLAKTPDFADETTIRLVIREVHELEGV